MAQRNAAARLFSMVAVCLASVCQASAAIDLAGVDRTVDLATEMGKDFINSSDTLATLTISTDVTADFSGSISGNIRLKKAGSGTLGVTKANDFTGGVLLDAGTINFTVAGSLGDGQISIAGGATLQLGAAVKCENPIYLKANGSVVKFASAANNTAAGFSGEITCASDVTKFTPTLAAKGYNYSFHGPINLPNVQLTAEKQQERRIRFCGPVTVKNVYGVTSGQTLSFAFISSTNSWSNYTLRRYNSSSYVPIFMANSIPTNSYVKFDANNADRAAYNAIYVYGDQKLKYVSANSAGYKFQIDAQSAGTVTFTEAANLTPYPIFTGAMGVVIDDADGGTWNIANGASTMTGVFAVSNGTVSVGGTATFANVPRVVVAAGAAFSCTSTGTTPLKSLKHLDLASDATFTLGDGISVTLESFSVNGKISPVAEGWYTGSDNPSPQAGDKQTVAMIRGMGRIYIPYQGSATEATWNGGAGDADTSVKTGANWEGGSAPDLSGGLTATFATGGSTATFEDPASLEKIVLNRATGFTLAAGTDDALVTLADGMDVAAPSGSAVVTNVVAVPVKLTAEQAWQTPANTVLELKSPISAEGATSLYLGGAGTYCYYGTNTFAGTVYLTNGTHRVYAKTGAFGSTAADGIVDYRPSLGATLQLNGVKIERGFKMTKASGNNAAGMTFAGATNEFAGNVTMGANWTPGASGTVVFSGGGTINSYFRPTSGTFVFKNKPMGIGTGYMLKSAHRFLVASNAVDDIEMNQNSSLHLFTPMAFKDRPSLKQDASTGVNPAIVYLNGCDQAFGHLSLYNDYGYFATPADKPARLSFRQTSDTALSASSFRGPISLEVVGANGIPSVSVNGAMQATGGELTVKDATLAIGANGSFASVTNVVVSGASAVLSVAQDAPFARKPNVTLVDDAKVNVPAGVVLRVGELRVGDKLLHGEITAATHPDVVTGEGKIRASGGGLLLSFR